VVLHSESVDQILQCNMVLTFECVNDILSVIFKGSSVALFIYAVQGGSSLSLWMKS